MQVLILTHNILVERPLVEKLQRLNIEVLSSAKLLTMLQTKQVPLEVLSFFDVLIVSETISDQELTIILEEVGEKFTIIRQTDRTPQKEEKMDWETKGVDEWLLEDETLSGLREKLAEKTLKESVYSIGFGMRPQPEEKEEEKRAIPLWNLTRSEREMLSTLISTKDAPISRNDLAVKIWGDSDSASHMTRLSTIIKHLRNKLKIDGVEYDVIRTNWGEGYQLSKVFFDHYIVDDRIMDEIKTGN
ncbi:helix-turn-helix domain-containing protein [Enterococcus hulanensis]|uniref:Helix-turn-helix domain-containing protein n=1 Tax=Enterococcus hulanensis TaxID=2559929 RepID=A0ABU3EYF8_9ENTE|nr:MULTISPECIES: helix-turn-helix domain-containing protein [Enterococcus]MBX8936727.1 winged helix-turn-helix domain-containing protein [Enterococcus gilvus]MDT2599706.1 helix-turn-helix domain-containing protein [Enterococcus hulanensis]MDT2609438.1 helix-turn-helix domain-containing protein [Enterococcus hulanensis]MDT2616015.1 helix-turn-helix domain-containing protein [Enterococcus hulanensis]MDT2627945.1 helix-turn-helix domain-containing protein [Enterococcus hulanensis]